MSAKSRKQGKKTSSSRGKSSTTKRVRDGTKHKSKARPLRCRHCGRFFANLGEINAHYRAAGHKKTPRPPKRFKVDLSKYDQSDLDKAFALMELLKNPREFREKVREQMTKRQIRRDRFDVRG